MRRCVHLDGVSFVRSGQTASHSRPPAACEDARPLSARSTIHLAGAYAPRRHRSWVSIAALSTALFAQLDRCVVPLSIPRYRVGPPREHQVTPREPALLDRSCLLYTSPSPRD